MNRILCICVVILFATISYSQEPTLSLKVSTENGESVSFASVTIMPEADTMAKQNKMADSSGTVHFRLQDDDRYIIRVSSVEYGSLEKSFQAKPGTTLFRLVLRPVSKALNNLVVGVKKPLMRQEDDKTIIDPEPLAISSTNAFELLEKTPGFYADQEGNIYLNSTAPARIYINGREQRMGAANVMTILKSLPPTAIASIEVLRTPSARYDASGGGGIINVLLRKGIRIGLTGSLNAGMSQGRLGNRFLGFNLNNNNGKISSYLSVQASRNNSFEETEKSRLFAPDTLLSQQAYTTTPVSSYFLGYGFNYRLGGKWDLNYDGRLSYTESQNNSSNASLIRKNSTDQVTTENFTSVSNLVKTYTATQGLNARYRIDSAGSEWVTDLSASYSPGKTRQLFNTKFSTPFALAASGDAQIENNSTVLSAATNVLKKLKGDFTLEAGAKASLVQFSNSNNYFKGAEASRVKDNLRTGAYNYQESINAAYVQAAKVLGSLVVKAGARLENTNMQGHQLVPNDTAFALRRTDLFPYVFVSKNIVRIAGYNLKANLVYRRTITRPAYENLNPSPRYMDPYLFEVGNPSLQPQFVRNYEANLSIDEKPVIAVGINDTRDIVSQVVFQADSNRSQAYQTYVNLGKSKERYIRALGALPPGKKYFFVLGVQYNYNEYEGIYLDKPLTFQRGSWRLFTYHNLRLTPSTQLSLNGFLLLNGQMQFYALRNFGQMNMNISQQLMKKKLTVSLNAQDLFRTNKNEFVQMQDGFRETGIRKADTRRFGVNLRYNFGIRKESKRPEADGVSPRS